MGSNPGGGGGGGSGVEVLAQRSHLLCAWGRFEATNPPGGVESFAPALSFARTLFREAVDTWPGNARAWVCWAHAEGEALRGADGGEASTGIVRTGRRRASPAAARQLAVIDEGLAHCAGNVHLLHARAMSLKTAGDLEGARAALAELSETHPTNAYLWHALGTLLQEMGAFDEAVEMFERGAYAGGGGGDLSRGEGAANLMCLTAAAAAAHHGGDLDRARLLFMRGSGLASAYGEGVSSIPAPGGEGLGAEGEYFYPTAAVSGDGVAYGDEGGSGSEYAASSSTSGSRSSWSGSRSGSGGGRRSYKARAREAAIHLRLWALMEKRAAKNTTARALFARASVADPSDAATWLQWGQFERRVSGPDAARVRFAQGLEKSSPTPYQQHLYQAWATMEAAEGRAEEARDLFQRGVLAYPRAAPLWLEFGLFEAGLGAPRIDAARRAFERGAAVAPPYPPVFEAWAALERGVGDDDRAAEILARGGLEATAGVDGDRPTPTGDGYGGRREPTAVREVNAVNAVNAGTTQAGGRKDWD